MGGSLMDRCVDESYKDGFMVEGMDAFATQMMFL